MQTRRTRSYSELRELCIVTGARQLDRRWGRCSPRDEKAKFRGSRAARQSITAEAFSKAARRSHHDDAKLHPRSAEVPVESVDKWHGEVLGYVLRGTCSTCVVFPARSIVSHANFHELRDALRSIIESIQADGSINSEESDFVLPL